MDMRVGIGYDAHRLAEGRRLVLGGVEIPFPQGLSGWSDADVLTHAIMDALLGAAGLGDIGGRFPPGEPEYEGIESLKLLKRVGGILKDNGWQVANIDATIVAEKPRLSGFVDEMRANLARALDVSVGRVSVKATTQEGVGFTGRGEGMAALATALLEAADR